MFCMKCGQKLPDEAKFCNKCGAPVLVDVNMKTEREDAGSTKKQTSDTEQSVSSKTSSGGSGGWSSRQKLIIIIVLVIAAAAVAAVIGGFAVKNHSRESVNTQEEIELSEETVIDTELSEGPVTDADSDDAPAGNSVDEDDMADAGSNVVIVNAGVAEEKGSEEGVEENAAGQIDATYVGDSSPEEYMSYVYETYFISGVDAEGFWDDCMSELTKELEITDRDTYVDDVVNNVNLNGLTYLSYEAKSSEDMGNGIYKIVGSLKYLSSEKQYTDEDIEYVITEGDHYKVLLYGYYGRETYTLTQSSEGIEMSECVVYYSADGSISMTCTLENHSSSDMNLGWSSGSQIELELSNGEKRFAELWMGQKIIAGGNYTMSLSFEDVNADLSKMTIHTVYILDGRGMPSNGSFDYTVSFE